MASSVQCLLFSRWRKWRDALPEQCSRGSRISAFPESLHGPTIGEERWHSSPPRGYPTQRLFGLDPLRPPAAPARRSREMRCATDAPGGDERIRPPVSCGPAPS